MSDFVNGASKAIRLELFKDDPKLQMRLDLDEDGIERMAEAYKEGDDFPPIEAVYDDKEKEYYLYDGHRRCKAAALAGYTSLVCILRHGTYRDAQLLAIAANQQHDKVGRSRTRQDKRRAVERLLNDSEWCKWSDSKISEFVGVSHGLVGLVRRELQAVHGSAAQASKDQPRQGKDGKIRTMPKRVAEDTVSVNTEPNDTIEEPEADILDAGDQPEGDYGETIEYSIESSPEESWISPDNEEVEETEEQHGDAFETGVDPDIAKGCKAKAREWNSSIEAFIRRFDDLLKLEPEGPFLDDTAKKTVRQCLNQAFGAYRATKYHSEPCPRCSGYGNRAGKMCDKCHGEGVMPKRHFEMMAAK